MMPLTPVDIEEEREAILSVLDQNWNIEHVINAKLAKEDYFYIIEKEFWDSWTDNVSFRGKKSQFAIRKQKKMLIDN